MLPFCRTSPQTCYLFVEDMLPFCRRHVTFLSWTCYLFVVVRALNYLIVSEFSTPVRSACASRRPPLFPPLLSPDSPHFVARPHPQHRAPSPTPSRALRTQISPADGLSYSPQCAYTAAHFVALICKKISYSKNMLPKCRT